MKITYDKEADAMYIELVEGEFDHNKKINRDTIIDVDNNGNTLGIEILNVSKKMPHDFLSGIKIENV